MRERHRVVIGCTWLLVGALCVAGDDHTMDGGDRMREGRGRVSAIIDALVPELMKKHHVPGVSVAVVRRCRLVWHGEYGVRCAGKPDKVTADTAFEACSMTKPLAAYAALKMAERGKLDLDRPLTEYLDKPYLPDAPLHKLITTRMILAHTTGFPNWRKRGNPLEVRFKPGTKYGYSGEGFQYLRHVMEHITGKTLDVYIKETLLEPLGMSVSSLVWEERYARLAAAGHNKKGQVKTDRPRFRRASAAASLFCSSSDYARFLIEMMKKDRSAEHSLGKKSIQAMLTRHVKANDAMHRGLGWAIAPTHAGDRVYHSGSNGTGFCCWSEFYPDHGSGIVIMTNSLGGAKLHSETMEAVRSHLIPVELIRTEIPARVVKLQAECTYRNDSATDIQRFVHRVTMPPADLDYQVLLDVSGDGIKEAQVKKHKNGIDRFLSFSFAIPARSSVTHRVAYTVLLLPLDYLKGSPRWPRALAIPAAAKAYLEPSRLIESDAQPVKDIADVIAKKTRDRLAQIRLAYEYPAKHVKFKPQPPAGALSALRTGIGDCTEYAALFAAICRALDIPARQAGVFNLGKSKDPQTFKCPNHDTAEVYMGTAGWVPVDPNLGWGKYNGGYGLARMGNSVVVLVREGSWVWSNCLPRDGYDKSKEKPKLSVEIKWHTEIIREGNAVALYGELVEQKAQAGGQ